jgi:type IV pilus assembly protein PilA
MVYLNKSVADKMKQKIQTGFTLIELLVIIAIIAFISALVFVYLANARVKSRDAKRVAEVKTMMTALEQFFSECGRYPTGTGIVLGSASYTKLFSGTGGVACTGGGFGTTESGTTYIGKINVAPVPHDGSCTALNNSYTYTSASTTTFSISFCLGQSVQGIGAGPRTGSQSGIQ